LLTVCHVLPQVIQAYNRILDLKEKHVDVEVLQILVNAACSSDAQGDIKTRAEQLLTRLTQQVRLMSLFTNKIPMATIPKVVSYL
jgi:hypothetical protein